MTSAISISACRGSVSFMTDGHKLGQLPVATGFFLIRDASLLEAVPLDWTFIHTLTATKPGDHAATAWAVMRHLGRAGYRASTARAAGVGAHRRRGHRVYRRAAADGETAHQRHQLHLGHGGTWSRCFNELSGRGWGSTFGHMNGHARIRLSLHPYRDADHAHGFVEALRESVHTAR